MTAFVKTELPDAINTLERLAAYSLMALARCNPELKIIETAGLTQKAVDPTIFAADDGTIRYIGRISLELDTDYVTDTTQPLYMKVQELSVVALPVAYKQA